MAVKKLSQIAAAGAITGSDTIIGVQSGPTDVQYTVTNMAAAILAAGNGVTAASVLTSGRIPMGDGARGLADTGAGTIGTSLAIGGAIIGSNALAVTGTAAISSTATASGLGIGGVAAVAVGVRVSPIAINANVLSAIGSATTLVTAVNPASDINGAFIAYSNNASAAELDFLKTRATGSTAATTAVQNSDMILQSNIWGASGTAYQLAGLIQAGIDSSGTISNTSMPGRIIFSTTPNGSVTPAAVLTLDSAKALTFGAGPAIINSPAAASLQFGALDAAVAVAQTTRVQSVVAGTAAANGANWTLIGSLPTGTGTSGDIIFQTGVKTGSGTTQGTPTTALTIKGETQALVTSALDSSTSAGGALQVAGGASVAKRFWIPAITASAGLQTAVLCQSSGGEMIADSVACLASSARFKTLLGNAEGGALDKIIRVPIHRWRYNRDPNSVFPDNYYSEHIGPTAEDVEAIDERLVGRDQEGKARSISTDQLLALTIQAIQEQQEQIEKLKKKAA